MSSSSFRITRRRLLTTAGITGAAAVTGALRLGVAEATTGPSSYTASWPSVDQHPAAPEWFQDAKFRHLLPLGRMPSSAAPFNASAYVVKLTFSGQIPTLSAGPVPTGWVRIANATTGLVLDMDDHDRLTPAAPIVKPPTGHRRSDAPSVSRAATAH